MTVRHTFIVSNMSIKPIQILRFQCLLITSPTGSDGYISRDTQSVTSMTDTS